MRINNVSTETSGSTLVVMSIVASVVTILLIWGYIATSATVISFFGFFQWLFDIFQSLRAEMSDEPFLPWFMLIAIVGIYAGFIGSFISRYKALKKFNNELNIKYINFLPGVIEFFFTKPEYNFKCAYQDMKELYMDIESQLVRTKNGSYIAFKQMKLIFTDLNGKSYKLYNTTSSPMKLIYKIIDWTRQVQKFEYNFSGHGEIPDYKEKIDEYLQLGYKDIVGKDGESKLKLMSLLFFIIGIIIIIPSADMYINMIKHSGMIAMLLPNLIFIFISFICDIILVIDKIRDNKYRGYNG